jgi:hypothetical protein
MKAAKVLQAADKHTVLIEQHMWGRRRAIMSWLCSTAHCVESATICRCCRNVIE